MWPIHHWTEAQDAKLTDMARRGFSASEILRALHDEFGFKRSRNSIIGRCRRKGLRLHGKSMPTRRKVTLNHYRIAQ